jgi:cell division protein FtsB
MPSARSASPARRSTRSRPRPVPARSRQGSVSGVGAAAMRVRWDRVGRVALLLVLVGMVALYVDPARSYLSTWQQSRSEHARVQSLQREHVALLSQRRALNDPRTVEAQARALGMVRPGEHSYVVRGLPGG